MVAYLFAGQGAQHPEMGAELQAAGGAAARILEEVSDLLGYRPASLPAAQLRQTAYAQPAIFAVSLAAWALHCARYGQPKSALFAGFSLGEYTALAASGVLSLADALRLVVARAALMQQACDSTPGFMSAVLGLSAQAIQTTLSENNLLDQVMLANHNAPLQSVISGRKSAMTAAGECLQTAGARRVVPLDVAGAFHTPFMSQAAAALRAEVGTWDLAVQTPKNRIFSNVTAAPLTPAQIGDRASLGVYLEAHMTRPVHWVEEVVAIHDCGADRYIECGPGQVLAGLVGKILPGTRVEQVAI